MKLNILIIEDGKTGISPVIENLQIFDYNFKAVKSPDEISTTLQKQPWDIVITEYMLTDFDAIHILHILKSQQINIPVIVISDLNDIDIAVQTIKSGAAYYLLRTKLHELPTIIHKEVLEHETQKETIAETVIEPSNQNEEDSVGSVLKLKNKVELLSNEISLSQQRLKEVQKIAHLGSWELNIQTGEVVWSEELYNIFGYNPAEQAPHYEQQKKNFAPDDWQKLDSAVKRAIQFGEAYTLDLAIIREDGSTGCVLGKGEAKLDDKGTVICLIGIAMDISERKQAEKKQLETSIRLEAINKELEAFSYSVSHDLRGPLRGIDGWSLALLEDYGGILDEKANQYLHRVRTETQRMGILIDDILTLSKMTRSEMKWEMVNLSELAKTILANILEEYPDRLFELDIQPDLIVKGDANLLKIMLVNLFNNACKFTKNNDLTKIEFGKTIFESKETYYVKDNGVGFNMDNAKNLFGAFQRMHKQSEFPGTGIGLTTVQRIIHRHHGTIWAEAYVQKGATFYFTLNQLTE